MIPIYTKLLKKKWFCFSTFDGYDYCYTGKTKEIVQNKMKKRLKKNDLDGQGLFMEEQVITEPQETKRPPIGYAKSRIDNL